MRECELKCDRCRHSLDICLITTYLYLCDYHDSCLRNGLTGKILNYILNMPENSIKKTWIMYISKFNENRGIKNVR